MTFRAVRSAILIAAISVIPASAFAQTRPWFVGGLGGVTFGTVASGALGAQFGTQIRPNLFVIGEVGRMRNVMPREINDMFESLRDEFEFPVTLEVSAPATYAFGGLRFVQPRRPVAPFVEGGAGFGRVGIQIDRAEVLGEDFKSELEDELGSDRSETAFLLAIGGGVHARLRDALGIDVGYRYTLIAVDDPAVKVSMIYVAVKFGR